MEATGEGGRSVSTSRKVVGHNIVYFLSRMIPLHVEQILSSVVNENFLASDSVVNTAIKETGNLLYLASLQPCS